MNELHTVSLPIMTLYYLIFDGIWVYFKNSLFSSQFFISLYISKKQVNPS